MAGLLKQRGYSLPAPGPVPRAVQEQVGGLLAACLTRGVGASPPARPQPKPRDQPRGHPAQEVTPARVDHVTPPARHRLLATLGPQYRAPTVARQAPWALDWRKEHSWGLCL